MDMKKLKQSMWDLLMEFPKEADAEANHSGNGEAGHPGAVGDRKLFSGLTMDLQQSLPPLMAQNLSIPLAFACLLHLANEKVGKPGKCGHGLSVVTYWSFLLVTGSFLAH